MRHQKHFSDTVALREAHEEHQEARRSYFGGARLTILVIHETKLAS